jgi:hypothetical protein
MRKSRNHIVLFVANTPYKPKVVKAKTSYTRKQKHKGKIVDA